MALILKRREDSVTDVAGCNYLHGLIVDTQLKLAEQQVKNADDDAVRTIGDTILMVGRFSSCLSSQEPIREANQSLIEALMSVSKYQHEDAIHSLIEVRKILGSPP